MSTNDPRQQQMIREAMKAIAERRPGRTKLVYDKNKRTIVAVAEGNQSASALNITAEDADMFAVITLSTQWLHAHWPELAADRMIPIRLSSWDSGDAFTQYGLGVQPSSAVVDGAVLFDTGVVAAKTPPVRVTLTPVSAGSIPDPSTLIAPDGSTYEAQGWSWANNSDEQIDVVFVDVQPALATRRAGFLETSVLQDTSVLCIGLGTGGAHAVIELAKCGVGRFILVDPDRLSVGNVVRHPGGVSQVGRLKVNVVRDLILEKNPEAQVFPHAIALTFENVETIRTFVHQANVVICGTDNRPSKLLINQLCIEGNTVAVYGGAFRRAYGGQILRVRPKESPCQQCFVSAMPEEASDVEISSSAAAQAIAYTDQPVPIEPGLSLDVLPIANLLTKLALLELLADKPTSLNLLHRDFNAPWYLWLNRPEPGTQYASWPPLSESQDEMTICRWYGIYFERDPGCPSCGDFISATAEAYDLDSEALNSLPPLAAKD